GSRAKMPESDPQNPRASATKHTDPICLRIARDVNSPQHENHRGNPTAKLVEAMQHQTEVLLRIEQMARLHQQREAYPVHDIAGAWGLSSRVVEEALAMGEMRSYRPNRS